MLNRICWHCRFFDHNNQMGTYSGKCRRHAPKGIDSNSFVTDATRNAHRVQMGIVDAGLMTPAISPVALYITQGVQVLPTSSGNGLKGDDCFPFTLGAGHRVSKLHITSILMNTGAATVGENPVFKIGVYTVDLDTDTLQTTWEVPIPVAYVGIKGNRTNNFFHYDYSLPLPWPEVPFENGGTWAAKFILEDGDPDIIGEIDNTIMSAEIDFYGADSSDYRLFPWIIEGNTFRCGEYQFNTGIIPALL